MKRTHKKIIIALAAALIASLALFINYLNRVYLPVKIKARIISGLSEGLQRDVDIGKIDFSLISGISIYDISVYDKSKKDGNTLLRIGRASFHFLYIPLLKEQKIIIPLLRVYSPQLNLRLYKDGSFDIPPVLSAAGTKGKNSLPLVYKINIYGGSVFFKDERQTPAFGKEITDLDISLSAGNLKKISFLLRGNLSPEAKKPSKIFLQGSYAPGQQEFNARLKAARFDLPEIRPYLQGILDISSGSMEDTDLRIKSKGSIFTLSGESFFRGLKAKKEGLSFEADAEASPQLSFDAKTRTLSYKVNLGISSAKISGIPYINEAYSVRGALEWSNEGLRTNLLEFRSLDSDFSLSGSLQDFSSPLLKAVLSSEQLDMKKTFLLFSKLEDIALSGKSKLKITLQGKPEDILQEMKAELLIEDAELNLPLLKEPLEHIKGGFTVGQDTAGWEGLSFSYAGTPYTSSGKITGLTNPRAVFNLRSKDFNLDSDIKVDGKIVSLRLVKAKYLSSSCEVKGSVNTEEQSKALLDLEFSSDIEPQDITSLVPKETADTLNKLKPKGKISLSGTLSGRAEDPKGWNIQAQGSSDTLSVYNLKFGRLAFNLAQKDRMLGISELTASPYSGTFHLDFICNLMNPQPSYSLRINSMGILLEEMAPDIGIKDKNISGIIDTEVNLIGNANNLSSLKGNGNISLRQGRLWQINLLKGLGELFLLPDYKKIIFSDAHASFNVSDNAVSTEDLQLISEQLKLNCEGKIGFDGKLNFTAYAQVNKELIRESADLRKFTAAIFGQLSSAITIKIGGTIQKPSYHLLPIPLDVIKGIKDFLLGK